MNTRIWLPAVAVILIAYAPAGFSQGSERPSHRDKRKVAMELKQGDLEGNLSERRKKFGNDDARTADAIEQLAGFCSQSKESTKAISLYTEAAAIRLKKFDPARYKEMYAEPGMIKCDQDNPSYLYVNDVDNLHWQYVRGDQFKKAEEPCRKLVELADKYLGPNHEQTGRNLVVLAACCNKAGDYAEAEKAALRGVAIDEKVHGPQEKNLIPTMQVLAHIYVNMEDDSKAEPIYKRELAILDAKDPKGPWKAGILEDYAELLRRVGKAKSADAMDEEAKQIRIRTHTWREHKVGGELLKK